MKNKLLIIVLFLMAVVAQAQDSNRFAPVGAEWYYDYMSMYARGYVHIEAVKDTVIDDIICTKLEKTVHGYDYYAGLFTNHIGNEYVTQSNDSVMIYRNGTFQLLFDFGAAVGDSWTLIGEIGPCEQSWGQAHVVEVGTETINGQVLKYVKLLDDQYSCWGYGNNMVGEPSTTPVKIIEKIGPMDSYLLPSQKCVFDDSEGGPLRCYIDDDLGYNNFSSNHINCGYINDQYQSVDDIGDDSPIVVFPNPCEDVVSIVLNHDRQVNVRLYNNQGCIVYEFVNIFQNLDINVSQLPDGMYVIQINDDNDMFFNKIVKK